MSGVPTQQPPVSTDMLRALSHAGNYVAGAFIGDHLAGGSVGFFGAPVGHTLHSHITGVSKRGRGHNVGYALKMHQRTWALHRGLRTITWTFDPLVARNAYFNITKLGAHTPGPTAISATRWKATPTPIGYWSPGRSVRSPTIRIRPAPTTPRPPRSWWRRARCRPSRPSRRPAGGTRRGDHAGCHRRRCGAPRHRGDAAHPSGGCRAVAHRPA
ncbi:Uncharacterized conserved protein [Gordonia bronchialis]|nr:Uncharacterized conserved protein [Gordonia bronchialis]